jgi:ABC-type dipeptide/oligopeptide/nickel transport system permease subunit
MARLIRGQILSLREQEYVLAAKTSGAKAGRIICGRSSTHLSPALKPG